MWVIWLIAGIIFTIAEILYSGFFLLWFAIGCFVTLICSLFIDNLILQCIIFLCVSIILLLTLTKYFTEKFSNKDHTPTNVDKLIGKTGIVTDAIGKTYLENGQVKLDGEIWTATSTSGKLIEKGTLVQVTAIKGVRLIVIEVQN